MLGGALSCSGSEAEAVDCLRQASQIEPCNLDYRLAYAGSLLRLERNEEAEAVYSELTENYPELALAWYGRGRVLEKRAEYADSSAAYERSLQLDNAFLPAYIGAGSVLLDLGLRERAREKFGYALNEGELPYEANVGYGLSLLPESYRQAEEYFRAALGVNPAGAAAYAGLSMVCKLTQDYAKAYEYGSLAVEYGSNDSKILFDQAILLRELGRVREAAELMQRGYNQEPENAQYLSGLLLTLQYFTDISRSEVFNLHKMYSKRYEKNIELTEAPIMLINQNKKKIRLGFVSADLCLHPVGIFLLPVLENIDKDRFEVYLFSNTSQNDQVSRRLIAASESSVSILSMSDLAASRYIRKEGIDILFDLGGHTPNSRLGIFPYRAAPLQLTWLGYPDTTGLESIDYRLVDKVTDPESSLEYMVEKPLYLDRCFLAYQADERLARYSPSPVIENKYITFGSFNNFAKFSQESYQLFAAVLKEVDNSRLLLKSAGLGQDWGRKEILSNFSQYGIEPERIILQSKTDNYLEHMNTYAKVDIALDTYPYNGTTTTCDALWMGVPVVTVLGEAHVSRVSGSILTYAGLDELVGKSFEGYIAIAASLAGDIPRLEKLRKGMSAQIAAITDIREYTAAFEAALEQLVEGNS